jgi:hypothetical protein
MHKTLIIFFITTLSLHISAKSISGSSITGSVTLSGIMQKLVVSDKLPIGGLTSSYGYEVLDFKESSKYKSSKNKALYCIGGMTMSLNSKVIGLSFGGNLSHVQTFNRCERPSDYAGGFIKLGVSLAASKGVKSIEAEFAVNIGMDLEQYNQSLIRHYRVDIYGEHIPYKERLNGVFKHFSNYLLAKVKSNKEQINTTVLKLLVYPLAPFTSLKNIVKFSISDMKYVKETKSLNLKQQLSYLRYDIFRDMDMYDCPDLKDYSECITRAADVLTYLEILDKSLSDCHAFSLSLSPQADFSISLWKKNMFSLNVGYYQYTLESNFKSDRSNSSLATQEFLLHNFKQRSKACSESADTAAAALGTYLSILKN